MVGSVLRQIIITHLTKNQMKKDLLQGGRYMNLQTDWRFKTWRRYITKIDPYIIRVFPFRINR